MKLTAYRGNKPKVHESVFVADGAHIIGDVEIGEQSSVWFNTVIRGDVHSITIGKRTNIQDASVLHVTHGSPLRIGSDVTVGHRVILHGCIVEDSCLIGMGSIVLDGALVRTMSMVAAGSLVLQGFVVPERTLVAGVPAKVKRPLTEKEIEGIKLSALNYGVYAHAYKS